jgi:hypothetical protein
MLKLKRMPIAGAVAAMALSGFIAMAPPASAEPNPPGCPRGSFCAYWGPNQTGPLLLADDGNWSGQIAGVESVFNNGTAWPGADHIQLAYRERGVNKSVCIHYNPGPGAYKMNFAFPGVTITSARWRGEC